MIRSAPHGRGLVLRHRVAHRDYAPGAVPNGRKLPWKIVDGVKVFHLVAEEVDEEFAPGLKARCWGYNGQVHGPVIETLEFERVRIYVTNRLKAATSVHWHGVLLPNGMDGVSGLNQKAIQPGETFKYEIHAAPAWLEPVPLASRRDDPDRDGDDRHVRDPSTDTARSPASTVTSSFSCTNGASMSVLRGPTQTRCPLQPAHDERTRVSGDRAARRARPRRRLPRSR